MGYLVCSYSEHLYFLLLGSIAFELECLFVAGRVSKFKKQLVETQNH